MSLNKSFLKKVIASILILSFSIALIKVGDVVLRYTSERYRVKKQVDTWNARIIEAEKIANDKCSLKLSLLGDTLVFDQKNSQKKGQGYEAVVKDSLK